MEADTLELAYQLIAFEDSGHQYVKFIHQDILYALNQIREADHVVPTTEPAGRTRATSTDLLPYRSSWAVDKQTLRRDVELFSKRVREDTKNRGISRASPSTASSSIQALESTKPTTPEPTDRSEPTVQMPANPPISERAAGKTVDPSESRYSDPRLTGESSTRPTTSHSNPSTTPAMASHEGTGFTPEQWKALRSLVAGISTPQQPRQEYQGPPPTVPPQEPREWRAEDIGYFDPDYEDSNSNYSNAMVSTGKHTFYKDVYTFVDRLRDMAKLRGPDKVRTVLPECLRGTALVWHSAELSEMEKDLLRDASLDNWFGAMIRRFKERTPLALQHLQTERYTMTDARTGKNPRVYAQEIFRHAKAAEMSSVYNQLSIAWNNLDVEFRRDIPEPTAGTSIRVFLDSLDSKADIWFELAKRGRGDSNRHTSMKTNGKQGRRTDKPEPKQDKVYVPYYGQPPTGTPYFPSPYRKNYNNDRNQQAQPVITTTTTRKPLLIENASKFDSKKPRRNDSRPPKGKQSWRPKGAANMAEEDEDEKFGQMHDKDDSDNDEPDGYYVANADLDYYEPEPYNEPEEPQANLAELMTYSCRFCRDTFISNNKLHQHLRRGCLARPEKIRTVALATDTPKAAKPVVIPSSAEVQKDIGTGCGFRNWHYMTAMVQLGLEATPQAICLDTGCSSSLIEKSFLTSQAPETTIRQRAAPVSVRGIGSNQLDSREYAILPMYFAGETKDGSTVLAKIEREVHIVENLKAKLLVGMDILGPELVDIYVSKKEVYLGAHGVTVPIEIRPRGTPIRRIVHARSTMVVPPHTELLIPVHYVGDLPDRDFLFEPNETQLSLYAHLVDQGTTAVLAKNDNDHAVVIARNLRLGTMSEIDYDYCYHVSDDMADLATRKPQSTHQTGWMKRVFHAFVGAATVGATVNLPEEGTISPYRYENTITAPSASLPEFVLPNGVTIHGKPNSVEVKTLNEVVLNYPKLWEDTGGFVDIPQEDWMRIPLKEGWESIVKGKAKVYPLGDRDRDVVDKTFDELHQQRRIGWTKGSTPFSYPVFVVWKALPNGNRKGRVVVDIRELNRLTLPDAYPLPLQSDIISAVRGCKHITVVDCASFFYQWRVHPDDRHKLTVVSHRGQESFGVAVMGYKNSPAYVQRQIDRILRPHRRYAKAYIDDVVIFSKDLVTHVKHLHAVFSLFVKIGISIKANKAFLGYPTVQLLGQRVDSLGLATSEDKLKAISKLEFPRTLRELETYLGMTGWLRNYIPHYAAVTKPLQDRKKELLKPAPKSGNPRKSYSSRTKLSMPNAKEIASFTTLQSLLSRPSYLTHFDPERRLYIDLDASKQFGFGAMAYHTKGDDSGSKSAYPAKSKVEPILFLSRLLKDAETRYWPTELEIAGLVWVVKKVRHMVESSKTPTIIHTDHGASVGIAKQTSLTTSSTDKLNLRLVRASEYLQRFDLDIRYKPGKQHIVPDALSRLSNAGTSTSDRSEAELDALYAYTTSLVELDEQFKTKLREGYKLDEPWRRVADMLDKDVEDNAKLSFVRADDGLIWHLSPSTGDLAYQHSRLCVPKNAIKDVLQSAHDQSHQGFSKCFNTINDSWYIRNLTKHLRLYLLHCPQCQVFQTRRHKPYGSMQPIDSPPAPFHTITMDFILALPTTLDKFDSILTVTDKFSKRVTLIPGKATFTAAEWAKVLLSRLELLDWGIPKVIISDRDRKFLSAIWKTLFNELGVKLLYSTAYHPQTDGQSERTNQTIEIALRFYLAGLENIQDWPTVLPRLQSEINNSKSISTTSKTPNEIVYGFTPNRVLDLVKPSSLAVIDPIVSRIEAKDALDFAAVTTKHHYDRSHQPLFLKVGDYALLRLHRGYSVPSITNRKLGQQYVGPFQVVERVGRLAYRLDIPTNWRVHPVFTIAHLEPAPPPSDDPFERPRPNQPESVHVEGDTEAWKSYELDRLINKRRFRRGKGEVTEYLVKWKGYGPEYDQWMNVKDLADAPDLVRDYEQSITTTTDVPGRLHLAIPPVRTDMNASKTIRPRGRPRKTPTVVGIPTTTPATIPQRSSSTSNPSNALILRDGRTDIARIG